MYPKTSQFAIEAYKDKCKKNIQFKKICNGDTAYITQLKQQK